ncbi:phosphoribosyl-AMP cyclohydrolase [Thermoproteota archaeon]
MADLKSEAKINDREKGTLLKLDFSKLSNAVKCGDLIPVVVQDIDTKDVLILGYMNEEALSKTLADKVITFWSTSRNRLWVKGDVSGDYLDVEDVRVNCEQNSLLFLVRLRGKGVCHVKKSDGNAYKTCFYRRITGGNLEFL